MRKLPVTVTSLTLSLLVGSFAFAQESQEMNFFVTSRGLGDGANLGGLLGADRHCSLLAAEAGSRPGRTWRAYLSTTAQAQLPAVHARNRIGTGPWYNAKGVVVAKDVDHLHSDQNHLTKDTALTEKGEVVQGRGDTPNRHDILTGSGPDGRAASGADDTTCRNWTSNGEGSALLGHHDRVGMGPAATSWNSSHGSKGCSQENLRGTGGDGLFYCFAAD